MMKDSEGMPFIEECWNIWDCSNKNKQDRLWFNKIARTFNFKDMNFGECIDEAEREYQERIRQKSATRKLKK